MPATYRKRSANTLYFLPASEHHSANTYFHFSFANYYDPNNMHYGTLRVINDDTIAPHAGFERHSHRDMEIVSYIIDGKLTHWDSALDKEEVIKRGNVQAISAGTGIFHSEYNHHDEQCRLLQIWVIPSQKSGEVRYNLQPYSDEDRQNNLLQIICGNTSKGNAPLVINQDINMFVSELTDKDATVTYHLQAERQAYINNIEGAVEITNLPTLEKQDSLEIVGPVTLEFKAKDTHAHFIIIEMQESK